MSFIDEVREISKKAKVELKTAQSRAQLVIIKTAIKSSAEKGNSNYITTSELNEEVLQKLVDEGFKIKHNQADYLDGPNRGSTSSVTISW